jgi:hypothetical protein
MSDNKDHITHYTQADIDRYLQGRLTPAEMHALEKAALLDPFLADAIEGYREADPALAAQHLADIRQQLSAAPARIRPIPQHSPARWWRAAAVILLVAGGATAGWLIWNKDVHTKELAQANMPQSAPAPADTVHDNRVPQPTVTTSATEHTHKEDMAVHRPAAAIPSAKTGRISNGKNIPVMNSANPKTLSAGLTDLMGKRDMMQKEIDATREALMQKQQAFNAGAAQEATAMKMAPAPASARPIKLAEFAGVVKDSKDSPVSGALVTLANTKKGQVTDNTGTFRFLAPDTLHQMDVAALGFARTQLIISPGKPAEIKLVPNNETLNEVVVTGNNNAKAKTLLSRETQKMQQDSVIPNGGWERFTAQLRKKITDAHMMQADDIHGNIEAMITLNAKGKAVSCSIIKTFNRSLDAMIISSVKQASGWSSGKQQIADTAITINIRL